MFFLTTQFSRTGRARRFVLDIRKKCNVLQTNLSFFTFADQTVQWDIDFYPRGVRYGKAQIINVWSTMPMPGALEIPEVLLRTVRLSVTCKSTLNMDQRFMVKYYFQLIFRKCFQFSNFFIDWNTDNWRSK